MSYYLFLKTVHVGCVLLTLTLFITRGLLLALAPARLEKRFFRIAPHTVDTFLLGSAIALAIEIHQYPLVHDWLTAKVFALIAYIILGHLALKKAPTKQQKVVCFVGALAVFAYIVGAALAHSPASYFALISR